jgi:hypothetical protein
MSQCLTSEPVYRGSICFDLCFIQFMLNPDMILEKKWIKNNHPLKEKKIGTSSTQIRFLIASVVPSNHPAGSLGICVAAITLCQKKLRLNYPFY